MVLWIIAFLLILALIGAAVYLIIDLARLPGEIAEHRGHPYAEAVRIAGVLGIFTGIIWVLALIWAFVPYPGQAATASNYKSGGEEVDAGETVTVHLP